MTTTTRTASEGETLLRKRFNGWEYGEEWHKALDEALAAERRATVERIRDALERHNLQGSVPERVFAILDEEAARV